MTALVAILNKQAVALAADSAVTVTGGNRVAPKIYQANKLFALSRRFPVGVMVYSSAEIMTIPIETVIKVYRNRHGDQPAGTLDEYAARFLTFLKEDSRMFAEETRELNAIAVVRSYLDSMFREWIDRLVEQGFVSPSATDLLPLVDGWLKERLAVLDAQRDVEMGAGSDPVRLSLRLAPLVQEFTNRFVQVFSFSPAPDFQDRVLAICAKVLSKDVRTGAETGVVIAGFGEDEYCPHLKSFEFESSVDGVHKWFDGRTADASRHGGGIYPFAQTEMMETFMEGKGRDWDQFLFRIINAYLQKRVDDLSSTGSPNDAEFASRLASLGQDLLTHLQSEFRNYSVQGHIKPIIDNVMMMPKEELAVMAEALVNLTAIKRHFASDHETVGPPVDVAVISKGDGFIWIKRKHYFDPELNTGFMRQLSVGGPSA